MADQGPSAAMLDLVLDAEEQRRTRIAWLYYVEGKTQAEIGAMLGLNRVKVNRELAVCRETGMVQIRINGQFTECVALERELQRRHGLRGAIVVPTPERPEDLCMVLGIAAGHYVSDRLRPGMTVGVGWGRTLRWSVRSMRCQPVAGLTVTSMMGGIGRASELNTYETASRLAERHGATCYYLAAPTFADTPELRDLLRGHAGLQAVCQRGLHADLALMSVGGLDPASTVVRLGLITEEERRSLEEAGAAGDLLGHFLDQEGRILGHPLNGRVVGPSPAELGAVGLRLVVSGGPEKVAVLRGALRAGYVDVLITDERTARGLAP
jgi:DNA-binding transcriptional regulator LsrR (DeoR family)